MLFASDDDTFPIRCPFCHYEFYEKIGRLRTGAEIQCPACQKILFYDVKDFLSVLEQGRQNPHDGLEPFTRLRWKLVSRFETLRITTVLATAPLLFLTPDINNPSDWFTSAHAGWQAVRSRA